MFYLKLLKILYCPTKKIAKVAENHEMLLSFCLAPSPQKKKPKPKPKQPTKKYLAIVIPKEVLHMVVHCEAFCSIRSVPYRADSYNMY